MKKEKVILFKTPIMKFLVSHFTPQNAPFLQSERRFHIFLGWGEERFPFHIFQVPLVCSCSFKLVVRSHSFKYHLYALLPRYLVNYHTFTFCFIIGILIYLSFLSDKITIKSLYSKLRLLLIFNLCNVLFKQIYLLK